MVDGRPEKSPFSDPILCVVKGDATRTLKQLRAIVDSARAAEGRSGGERMVQPSCGQCGCVLLAAMVFVDRGVILLGCPRCKARVDLLKLAEE